MKDVIEISYNDILEIDGEKYFIFTSHEGFGLTSIESENFYGDTWETMDELCDMINHRTENGYIKTLIHYPNSLYKLVLEDK